MLLLLSKLLVMIPSESVATVIAVTAQPRPPFPAIMFDMFVGSKNKDLRFSFFISKRVVVPDSCGFKTGADCLISNL